MRSPTYQRLWSPAATIALGLVIAQVVQGTAAPTHENEQPSALHTRSHSENALRWDARRARSLYGDDSPIRIVQVVDTGNQLLVAHKPTIVRAFIHCPATTHNSSEHALSAELYMDGSCVSPAQKIHQSSPGTGEGCRGTINLEAAGTLRPSPGPHQFEVRVHHSGRTVLKRSVKANFATPQRHLVVVTVPIHVHGLFRTRRPSDEALSHSHRFVEAVFPLSGIEVIPTEKPYVIRARSCTGNKAESRRQRTILAAKLASQIPKTLQRRLTLEREKGNIAVVVGIAPNIRGLFGGQTGENIRGFAVPFAGTCVIKADHQVEFTLAHELGHLMPLPLHDSYQHDTDDRALSYAKAATTKYTPTGPGQVSGHDAAGIFINEAMGGFNIAYGNTHFSALPRQAPVVSGNGDTPHPRIRGFMGACGPMWATPAEYARLYACFVGH